jgi:hypothetical protein
VTQLNRSGTGVSLVDRVELTDFVAHARAPLSEDLDNLRRRQMPLERILGRPLLKHGDDSGGLVVHAERDKDVAWIRCGDRISGLSLGNELLYVGRVDVDAAGDDDQRAEPTV